MACLGAQRHQLQEQVSDRRGLVLSSTPDQRVRRSNPFGPSIFISQSSFSREPAIETRQSPSLPLRTCSIMTR